MNDNEIKPSPESGAIQEETPPHEPLDDDKKADSNTMGIPVRSESKVVRKQGRGIWGGARDVHTFRGDNGVYEAFCEYIIPLFGSTCKAFESLMLIMLDPVFRRMTNGENGYTQGDTVGDNGAGVGMSCLLYTSPSPRDRS